MIPRCPTCGSVVEVFTTDEGTSSFRPVVDDGAVERAAEAITDEMVERAVGGYREVAGRCSRQATRAALEAASGGAA